MEQDIDIVKDILKNLKEDPMRVIYTEHYLKQIERRNIPDVCIEELLENGKLLKINPILNSKFELIFRMDDLKNLHVIIKTFNRQNIILISAAFENKGVTPPPEHRVELEEIYDMAFDLMDLNSKHGFRFAQSVEMEHGITIDFDTCGHPAAVELLRPSKKFRLPPKQLAEAEICGQIEITPDLIKIHLKAKPAILNSEIRVIEKEIANDYSIPENTFDLIVEDIS